jgi:hypothetical protein
MSCINNNCYLPQPPRAWSRVQNSCSLETSIDNNGKVRVPLTGELVSASLLYSKMDMLNKGNVLQYKANSSNLTKAQKYSKIAKGQWVNRNTTWATQSTRGYTNPNTTSLKRSGNVVNIAIDPITGAVIGPTTAPPTCPKPVTPVNPALPSNGGGGSDVNDPDIPPPVEPTEGSDVFPPIIPDEPVEPIVIQDGGVLICSEQENICTGETKRSLSQQLCNPTSDSDVPGPIQELCWNDGTPTWYPRYRYIMTNSDNKWPYNSGIPGVNNSSITYTSAIRPYPPYITSITSNLDIVTLTWTQNETCLAVTRFDIYQDGQFIKSVDGTIFSTDIVVENCIYYQYYIIGVASGGDVFSDKSNTVSITITLISDPIISGCLYTISSSISSVLLNITSPANKCNTTVNLDVSYYIIYYSDGTTTNEITIPSVTSYIVNNLTSDVSYTFSIKAILADGQITNLSNVITINTTYQPFTYTGSSIQPVYYDSVNKIWSLIFSTTTTISFTQSINSTVYTTILGGGGGGGWSSVPSGGEGGYQAVNAFNNIVNGSTFTIISIGAGGSAASSSGSNNATQGSSSSFTGSDSQTYTVTGGFPGQTSGGQVTGASYSGPSGTNTYTGGGGYGGSWSGTCSNGNGWGGSSYLSLNQTLIENYTGVNIIEYFASIYNSNSPYLWLGGGGGSGGTVGGEGGSIIGNGAGGSSSCSLNLDTQDAGGYGAGGAAYYTGGYTIPNRPGNGSQGIFILFFKYPIC